MHSVKLLKRFSRNNRKRQLHYTNIVGGISTCQDVGIRQKFVHVGRKLLATCYQHAVELVVSRP